MITPSIAVGPDLIRGPAFPRSEEGAGPRIESGVTMGGGDIFTTAAARLSGIAGAVFGWSPDAFWRATPAELAAVVLALTGETMTPPDAATVDRLRKAFPDG